MKPYFLMPSGFFSVLRKKTLVFQISKIQRLMLKSMESLILSTMAARYDAWIFQLVVNVASGFTAVRMPAVSYNLLNQSSYGWFAAWKQSKWNLLLDCINRRNGALEWAVIRDSQYFDLFVCRRSSRKLVGDLDKMRVASSMCGSSM